MSKNPRRPGPFHAEESSVRVRTTYSPNSPTLNDDGCRSWAKAIAGVRVRQITAKPITRRRKKPPTEQGPIALGITYPNIYLEATSGRECYMSAVLPPCTRGLLPTIDDAVRSYPSAWVCSDAPHCHNPSQRNCCLTDMSVSRGRLLTMLLAAEPFPDLSIDTNQSLPLKRPRPRVHGLVRPRVHCKRARADARARPSSGTASVTVDQTTSLSVAQ